MVRPNQVVGSGDGYLIFILPARNRLRAQKRAINLNFPGKAAKIRMAGKNRRDFVSNVELVTEGPLNRYKITVDTDKLDTL